MARPSVQGLLGQAERQEHGQVNRAGVEVQARLAPGVVEASIASCTRGTALANMAACWRGGRASQRAQAVRKWSGPGGLVPVRAACNWAGVISVSLPRCDSRTQIPAP